MLTGQSTLIWRKSGLSAQLLLGPRWKVQCSQPAFCSTVSHLPDSSALNTNTTHYYTLYHIPEPHNAHRIEIRNLSILTPMDRLVIGGQLTNDMPEFFRSKSVSSVYKHPQRNASTRRDDYY